MKYLLSLKTKLIALAMESKVGSNNSLEDLHRITLVNSFWFRLNRQLKYKVLSRLTKIKLYQSLLVSVLLYGAEV